MVVLVAEVGGADTVVAGPPLLLHDAATSATPAIPVTSARARPRRPKGMAIDASPGRFRDDRATLMTHTMTGDFSGSVRNS